jgi:RHS repeat-associated protein
VVRRIAYGVWGEVRRNEVVGAASPSDPDNKFTDQRFDRSTGLYHYGARYYDAEFGRFTQPDPVSPALFGPQSLNRYSYVRNDPLSRVDPTGNLDITFTVSAGVVDPFGFTGLSFGVRQQGSRLSAAAVASVSGIPFFGVAVTSGLQNGVVSTQGTGFLFNRAVSVQSSDAVPGTLGYADLAIEAVSIGVGAASLAGNIRAGNTRAAVFDALALAADIGLAGVPLIPGGFSLARQGTGFLRQTTEFLANVKVRSHGKIIAEGTVDLRPTFEGIASGRIQPRRVFENRERLLPPRPPGYYREYVHSTPSVQGTGPQRIIRGRGGELYYTPDHYETLVPLN